VLRTFGPFTFDPDCGELARNGSRIRLQPQPALVLILLTDQPGKLVPREEIYRAVWGENTHVDFEQSLNYCIRQIRAALRDDADHPTYLETVPKRGYRFLCPVAPTGDAESQSNKSGSAGAVTVAVLAPAARSEVAASQKSSIHAKVWALAFGVLIVLATSAILWRTFRVKSASLRASDTVVLSDFANSTGDPIFDDTLKTALNVSLRQSPFLNVLSESEVSKTLHLMTRPSGTKLTPELAREICQRAGSKAYIAGSISSLGSEYVLGLKAVNCESGDTLAQELVTAASQEEVLDRLGEAAAKLRGELGESLATVQKFDVPLAHATTSSLEALKAYTLGRSVFEGDTAAALPYYQRALELDPNFAMGYRAVAGAYLTLLQPERARPYLTKAFELRDNASEPERLLITANYYSDVTGELEKAVQAYQQETENYPRSVAPLEDLSATYYAQGRHEKAAEATRQAIRVARENPQYYQNLAFFALALQHLDEARQILHDAPTSDDYSRHQCLYALAFLNADKPAMAEQQFWFASKPLYENYGLALASDTEAYTGHVGKAREFVVRAVDSAILADNQESGAIWKANSAVRQAVYGHRTEAERSAEQALKLAPEAQGVEAETALAFAIAGDAARAEAVARSLDQRFPLDTQVQSLWLPAIQAQLELGRKNPAAALSDLQSASAIELGGMPFGNNVSCLYHVYIHGEAYLAAGQGDDAAAEFQRILDHSGIVWNCWTGALAHLGLARANALQSKTSQGAQADAARVRALAAYKDFLTLWKDADPDIPILKEAKVEYAKLQ
jgi:DNA-binding winged helix-turn-helix (wHTH) protein/tetratricopeptide (TPR) repeat protein